MPLLKRKLMMLKKRSRQGFCYACLRRAISRMPHLKHARGVRTHISHFKITNMPSLMVAFYTPLRYVERRVWKIEKPPGSSC